MKRFLSEAAGKSFHDAIEDIERASAAEVMVVVRPGARGSLAPHVAVAFPLAVATLAYVLYCEAEYAEWEILVLPLVAAVLGAAAVAELGAIYRAVSPPHWRRVHVREAARAMFYARGVHATTKRTGMLVYVALRERIVELVGDIALCAAVDAATLARWGDAIAARLPDGVAAGRELAKLAGALADKLPHHAGDRNELADDVYEVARHPRGTRAGGVREA
jgi:putative membrane protein